MPLRSYTDVAQQCRPIAAAWHPDMHGQCYDNVTLFLSSAPVNILSDIAILMLPLPIITELRMERRAKIGLVMTFMCGVFVAAVDVGESRRDPKWSAG